MEAHYPVTVAARGQNPVGPPKLMRKKLMKKQKREQGPKVFLWENLTIKDLESLLARAKKTVSNLQKKNRKITTPGYKITSSSFSVFGVSAFLSVPRERRK